MRKLNESLKCGYDSLALLSGDVTSAEQQGTVESLTAAGPGGCSEGRVR